MKKLAYKLRRYFISGLLVWVPIWITVIVIKFLIDILDHTLILLPERYHIPGSGVILTLIIILLTGLIAANFVGKQIISFWDLLIAHIPFVRTIHTGVKDVLETLVKSEGQSFKKVCLVEFPRKGMWTVAFQTGENPLDNNSFVSLFIPTTPNITSGFLILMEKEKIIELKMSVDQALKFVISLSVVKPEEKK
ncbi:MAG: DUF502 domain-containing protein [Gammaproteobacteria bacterium]|nr:DUF502 domain-containing protein [Gammaproteobacteria bacterium]